MALKQIFKISRKTFFNPREWLGFDDLKGSFFLIRDTLKNSFTTPTARRTETFEEAMQRLKTTETDLQKTEKTYSTFVLVFLTCGALTLFFSFYLLFFHGSVAGCMLGLASGALFFTQAFKYHFWLFQIKHRKLGCTLSEWWQGRPNT